MRSWPRPRRAPAAGARRAGDRGRRGAPTARRPGGPCSRAPAGGPPVPADRLSPGPGRRERLELGGDGLDDIGAAGHDLAQRALDLVALAREAHAFLPSRPRAVRLRLDVARRPGRRRPGPGAASSRAPCGAGRGRGERLLRLAEARVHRRQLVGRVRSRGAAEERGQEPLRLRASLANRLQRPAPLVDLRGQRPQLALDPGDRRRRVRPLGGAPPRPPAPTPSRLAAAASSRSWRISAQRSSA